MNLRYFVTRDHSFSYGSKRIAATIFLYFLEHNQAIFITVAVMAVFTKYLSDSRVCKRSILHRKANMHTRFQDMQ